MSIGLRLCFSTQNNTSGFSFLEIMVSLVVMGITVMGSMHLGEMVTSQTRINRVGANVQQLQTFIRSRTFMVKDCVAAFGDANGVIPMTVNLAQARTTDGQPISVLVSAVRSANPEPLSELDGFNGADFMGLTVTRFRLLGVTDITSVVPAALPENQQSPAYLGFLELELAYMSDEGVPFVGSGLNRRHVISTFYFQTDSNDQDTNGNLTICRSVISETGQQELCEGVDTDGDGNADTGGLGNNWKWDAAAEICRHEVMDVVDCFPGEVLVNLDSGIRTCQEIGLTGQICPDGTYVDQIGLGIVNCAPVPLVRAPEDT